MSFTAKARERASAGVSDGSGSQSWRPEKEGEELVGWLDSIHENIQPKNPSYDPFTSVKIRTEEDEVIGVIATKVIRDLLVDPKDGRHARGAMVYIRFDGLKQAKNGNSYKAFLVYVEPPDGEDWEQAPWMESAPDGSTVPYVDVGAGDKTPPWGAEASEAATAKGGKSDDGLPF